MSMPPWFTGQMAESRMADRQMEAARRRLHPMTPPAGATSGKAPPSRSRVARWAGRALIAGGEWLAGRNGAVSPQRPFS
ncbi:MAG: hypothetical protein WBG41_12895 [Acidimicrobiales bacterium]